MSFSFYGGLFIGEVFKNIQKLVLISKKIIDMYFFCGNICIKKVISMQNK